MSPILASPKQRIVSVQVCRGIAALFVVFAHLYNVENKYFSTHFLTPFQFGYGGVDLFFVISGVVISVVTAGKFHNTRNAFTFLYHRFARVYPIYWIYTLVVLAAFFYNPHWINAASGSHPQILRSFLLIPSGVPFLLMQGWTLSYEIYFYLAFFLLLLLCPEPVAPWALAAWAAFILAFPFSGARAIGPISLALTSHLILEFLGGCLVFHLYRRSRLHPAAGVLLVVAACAWLAGFLLWATSHGKIFLLEVTLRPLAFGPFATLLVLGAMELERTGLVRFARPLVAIGDWSYSLYLSHLIVIEFFGRLFFYYFPHLHLAILPVIALSVPASLLVAYLSYTYLELPLVKLLYKPSRPPVSLRKSYP